MSRRSTLATFQHRKFRRVWAAGLVDLTGNWLQITGRAWLIYHVTGSTTALGAIYLLSYLPHLLLSQVGGTFADRYDRRRVLLCGVALKGLGALAMAAVSASGAASLLNVGAISVVVGIVAVLTMPAQVALLPSLVPREDLTGAISLTATSQAGTRVAGPLLAGALIPVVGATWLFVLNALTFTVILAVWLATPVAPAPKTTERGIVAATVGAARWVRRTPAVGVVLLTTLVVAGIGQMYQPLAVAFTTDVLAGGDDTTGARYFGLFQAAIGLGSAVGGLSTAFLARQPPRRTFAVAAVGCSVLLFLLGFTRFVPLVLGVAVAIGLFQFAMTTLSLTVLQHLAPEHMRGRVVSFNALVLVGPLPLIGLGGGALAVAIGLPATLIVVGAACLVYCVPFLAVLARHLPTEPFGALDGQSELVVLAEETERPVGDGGVTSARDGRSGGDHCVRNQA